MKIAQKTKMKKMFNEAGIQINMNALNMLDDQLDRLVHRWVQNTKDGNVRRLTPELLWIALGKFISHP
ncbi:MAG: hypothetical protein CMI54_07260 [Parcubacteria group bacterium]|jgi:hypothetical protein|nr:hypothetical protein [Parcubacteria group bacterium]|tara:strand:+ start:5958 stop:6161 length:204 start_codon:yes stop_codon:yes gene_type:complete